MGGKKIDSKTVDARPLVFGEVLFDTFPDGSERLGGAPFNVAWHLHGFGMRPLLVSRIGADERGRRLLAAMRDWGMDCKGIQIDPQRPTGVVRVSVDHGQPAFDILPDQAWDGIDSDEALAATAGDRIDLVYHGTLALRDPRSRGAVADLRDRLQAGVCVDLNLRAPWWSADLYEEAMAGAAWLKLNDAELRTVSGGGLDDADLRAAAAELRARHGIAVLVVTLGDRGAFMLAPEGPVMGVAKRVDRIVDTVGAGDAFSAVCLTGLRLGWAPALTLERALEFAAWICSLRGATLSDRDRYDALAAQWGIDRRAES